MKIRLNLKILVLIGFGFAMTVAFQNCSGAFKFTNMQDEASSLKSGDEGNGAGYGGKPTGDYSNFIPDWTCENREAAKATIAIGPAAFTLTENKILKCGIQTSDLNLGLVDSSLHQTDVIGYKDGIFVKNDPAQTSGKIPDNLVEAWCREEGNNQGLETITHFDRIQNRAVNRTYYLRAGVTVLIPDFPVSRLVSRRRVEFKNDQGFDLIVYRDRPATLPGQFQADLKARIDGKDETRKVTCRLGAALDPNVWPARVLADFDIRNGSLKISPNNNWLGYVSTQPLGSARLYAVQTTGLHHHAASPVNAAVVSGIGEFSFTPDSLALAYNLDLNVSYSQELFLSLLDQSGTRKLSNTISSGQQGVLPDFRFTPDGQSIFFRDSSQSLTSPTVTAAYPWLQITDLIGASPPKALNTPFTLADSKVHNFAISKTADKVLYLGGASYPDIFSVNPDGTNLTKITAPGFFSGLMTAATSNYWIPWWSPLLVPAGGNYAVFQGMRTGLPGFELFAMAIDGTNLMNLGANTTYLESSPNGDVAALMGPASVANGVSLYNFRTNTRLPVTSLLGGSFTSDSSRYLGLSPVGNSLLQATSVVLSSGQTSTLCSSVSSPIMKLQELQDGRIALLSYDIQNRILSVYIAADGGGCLFSNSIPIALDGIVGIKVSPDSTKLLVITQLNAVNADLLYIPLSGSPAYAVNAAAFSGARIRDAFWLKDSMGVIFYGDQVEPALSNAYLWVAP